MADKLIPENAQRAAQRGFIRTASQSIATALAGGVTVAIVTDAVDKAQAGDWLAIIVAAAVAIVTPLANGAQSYFSLLANGIPEDYKPELPPTPAD